MAGAKQPTIVTTTSAVEGHPMLKGTNAAGVVLNGEVINNVLMAPAPR